MPKIKIEIDVDSTGAVKGFKQVGGSAQEGFGKAKKSGGTFAVFMGTTLSKAFTASLNAAKQFITSGLRELKEQFISTLSSASDFDQAFREVTTLFGETSVFKSMGQSAAEVKKEILDMAGGLGSATELTKGLYQAISAGVPKENAIAFVGEAAKLAVAGLSDAESATRVLSATINSYGLEMSEAGKISDMLFKTVEKGVTTIPELASSLGNVVPIAAGLGISFDEVAAAMATLTAGGLDTATAATALKGSFTGLITQSAKFKEAGIDIMAVIKKDGLLGAMQALKEATKGDMEAMKALVPDTRALMAAMGLAGERADIFAENLIDVQNSAGATQVAFDKMKKSAAFVWKDIVEGTKATRIALGEMLLSVVVPLGQQFSALIPQVRAWVEAHRADIIERFSGIVESLKTSVVGVATAMREWFAESGADALQTTIDVLAGLKTGLSDVAKTVVDLAQRFRVWFSESKPEIVDTLKSGVTALGAVFTALSKVLPFILENFQTLFVAFASFKIASVVSGFTGLGAASGAAATGLTAVAAALTGPLGVAVAAAAAGAAVYKIITLWGEWRETLGEAADAEARAAEMTTRQQEQYKRLIEIMGTTREAMIAEGETYSSLIEKAAKDPHGEIAVAVAQLREESVKLTTEMKEQAKVTETHNQYLEDMAPLRKRILDLMYLTDDQAQKYGLTYDELIKRAEENPHGKIARAVATLREEQAALAAQSQDTSATTGEDTAQTEANVQALEKRRHGLVATREAAGLAAKAARDHAASIKEEVVSLHEFSNQVQNIQKAVFKFDIGGGEKVDLGGPEAIQGVLDRLKGVAGAVNQVAGGFVESFAQNVIAGDLKALEDLVGTVGAQASALRGGAAGFGKVAAAATEFETLAFTLNQILGQVRQLAPVQRATGGPIKANRPVIVGERGPELVTFNRSGMVHANSALKSLGAVARQLGGPLRAFQPTLVGEAGPEAITFNGKRSGGIGVGPSMGPTETLLPVLGQILKAVQLGMRVEIDGREVVRAKNRADRNGFTPGLG